MKKSLEHWVADFAPLWLKELDDILPEASCS
jgi:hypothetical protein